MDLVRESQEKAKILKDKDGLMKEIEKVRSESQLAGQNKVASEKEVQKLLDREKKLEVEITTKTGEIEKTVSRMEVMNARLSEKKQDIDVLERKVSVQQKVIRLSFQIATTNNGMLSQQKVVDFLYLHNKYFS